MTVLLELKAKLVEYYKKTEIFLLPVIKFIFALVILGALGSYLNQFDTSGKLAILDRGVVKMAMAAIVAFVPGTWFIFLIMMTIAGRLFFVSMEGTAIVFIVMMVLYLMFIRLFPKQAYLAIIMPFLMHANMAYVLPLIAGLFIGPAAIIPISVGVVVYFLSAYVPGLLEMTSTDLSDLPVTMVEMYRYFVDAATSDKGMMLMIAVFVAVIIATYFVSRLEMEYIHYIAIVFGGVVNIFGFIIGNIILGAGVSIGGVIIGTILAIIVGVVAQFFRFTLDYEKSEKLQFEDDDYYYYVKAVPKIKIAKSKKEIKTIQ